jgi:hypothetical protein
MLVRVEMAGAKVLEDLKAVDLAFRASVAGAYLCTQTGRQGCK